MRDEIVIRGAREHNLKNLNLTIPRDKLIVFTGLSGSGKSSLAFDTIYAEGQRRYVESLSSYARQFLGQMEKPDVDTIEGLSPAISIDQKSTSNNPRSTVGTVTEIHDYLRLLYARIGIPHCPKCGRVIRRQTVDEVVEQVMAFGEGARVQIIAPAVRGRKGEHVKLLEQIQKDGYVRVKVDGEIYDIADVPKLDKKLKHSIEELTPRMFSFNNPYGACPTCSGLGALMKIDPALIVPNGELSLRQGAINVTGWQSSNTASIAGMYLAALGDKYGFDMDTPFNKLSEQARHAILYGTGNERIHIEYRREFGEGSYDSPFEGVIPNLERRYKETQSDYMKHEIEEYMANIPCPDCKGKRLKSESLAVTVGGMNIAQLSDMTVRHAREKLSALTLNKTEEMIAGRILKEIDSRLGFLISVGLDYLTLSRAAGTLSGGEAQRIRLATQIGSSLVGVLYILDEPSIGLHQRDNAKLIDTLKGMRDIGNTLIVVEHDEETMLNADYIVDIGPGPGEHGGEVVFAGTPEEIMTDEKSITGKYLSGREYIAVPAKRRETGENWLQIRGARANNLKNVNVDIPLGVFTCVTGVSGSGKSSLVNEVLKKTLLRDLNRARTRPGEHDEILGIDKLDKIIDIDQSPIGRTPRSNPATYTGLFDLIRDVFAQTPDAKMRGYTNGRFSFNVKGGRCEACRGDGILKIEMHFLPDIYVPCEVCGGKRYNRETLEVKYKGKTIADVLDMTVEEAMKFFAPLPKLARKLQTLYDVGLGYIRLGQSSTTLSGGEAQRVKLATELARRDTGRTLYVLDEPTTGLHTDDVKRLIAILQRLCDGGSTVVVIEHNLDVIKTADHIIDLGPEGGDMGGTIVCTGTPEQVAQNKKSYTGIYLKPMLEKGIRE